MTDETLQDKARKRAQAKVAFYRQAYSMGGVSLLLFVINLLTGGNWWFVWPVGFMVLYLAIRAWKVFVGGPDFAKLEDRLAEEELEKLKKQ